MEWASTLNNAGALITAGLGVMGLVRPSAASEFTSLEPRGKIGVSEIRATYGGFFLALGAWALYTQSEAAFTVAGVAWLGAAGGRVVSVVADRSLEPKNFGGIVFEAVIGLFLLARW